MSAGWAVEALGEGWLGKALAGLAGFGGAFLTNFFRRRKTAKEKLADAADEAVRKVIEDLGHDRGDLRLQIKELRAEIAVVRQDQREERVKCDIEIASLRDQINKLMQGPVAGYGP